MKPVHVRPPYAQHFALVLYFFRLKHVLILIALVLAELLEHFVFALIVFEIDLDDAGGGLHGGGAHTTKFFQALNGVEEFVVEGFLFGFLLVEVDHEFRVVADAKGR